MHPRWVQTPMQMSHSDFLQRCASVAGSRMEGARQSSLVAESIMAWVRLRMKTGLLRHLTTKFWPSRTGRRSTSTTPAANTSMAGHMPCRSLQTTARVMDIITKPEVAARKYTKGRRSAWPMGRRLALKSSVPSGQVVVGCGAFSAQPTGRKFSGENLATDVIAGSFGSCQTSVRVTVAPAANSPFDRSGLRGNVGSRVMS
mmetsp:Transcript_31856/g.83553  ORF Transcript_31856/g.83553 Transcript_31856/m.83553 type:complete len:201 (-) Transcript_31856:116-718(-)